MLGFKEKQRRTRCAVLHVTNTLYHHLTILLTGFQILMHTSWAWKTRNFKKREIFVEKINAWPLPEFPNHVLSAFKQCDYLNTHNIGSRWQYTLNIYKVMDQFIRQKCSCFNTSYKHIFLRHGSKPAACYLKYIDNIA